MRAELRAGKRDTGGMDVLARCYGELRACGISAWFKAR